MLWVGKKLRTAKIVRAFFETRESDKRKKERQEKKRATREKESNKRITSISQTGSSFF